MAAVNSMMLPFGGLFGLHAPTGPETDYRPRVGQALRVAPAMFRPTVLPDNRVGSEHMGRDARTHDISVLGNCHVDMLPCISLKAPHFMVNPKHLRYGGREQAPLVISLHALNSFLGGKDLAGGAMSDPQAKALRSTKDVNEIKKAFRYVGFVREDGGPELRASSLTLKRITFAWQGDVFVPNIWLASGPKGIQVDQAEAPLGVRSGMVVGFRILRVPTGEQVSLRDELSDSKKPHEEIRPEKKIAEEKEESESESAASPVAKRRREVGAAGDDEFRWIIVPVAATSWDQMLAPKDQKEEAFIPVGRLCSFEAGPTMLPQSVVCPYLHLGRWDKYDTDDEREMLNKIATPFAFPIVRLRLRVPRGLFAQ